MVAKKIETGLESEEKETKPKKTKSTSKKSKAMEGFVANAEHELISVEAYYLAEKRGFAPGGEISDWLMAEEIIKTYFI